MTTENNKNTDLGVTKFFAKIIVWVASVVRVSFELNIERPQTNHSEEEGASEDDPSDFFDYAAWHNSWATLQEVV